jgi:hypothetical protein
MPRKALMMPEMVPNRPMKGEEVAIVARMERPVELLAEHRRGPFAASCRRLDLLVKRQPGFLAFHELRDAGGGHASEVASFVVFLRGEGQGVLDVAGSEKIRELGSDLFGFPAGPGKRHLPFNEQVEGDDREGDKQDGNRLGHSTHGRPHFD